MGSNHKNKWNTEKAGFLRPCSAVLWDGGMKMDLWGFGRRLRRSAVINGPKWFTQRRTVSAGDDDAAFRQ